MQLTYSTKKHQHNKVRQHREISSSYRFFNLLTSDALLDKVETLLPEHRERLYPPTETLSMFLAQAMSQDRSCQSVVNQTAVQRCSTGLSPKSTHTGGYCRARQRLPTNMVSELAVYIGKQIEEQEPDEWCWQGRRVRIVDGTTITMPDTDANQASFPQPSSQRVGLGFPICRVVAITCLSSGALLNAAIGRYSGKGGDERSLLRTIQDSFQKDDVVLGDALFGSYFFLAELQSRSVDILMEQQGGRKRITDFRRGQKLGERDHLITIDKPKSRPDWMSEAHYNSAPDCIRVREFKAGGKVMVTTMVCNKTYPKEELKALYKRRWNIELDIRDIKQTMGMDVLSCKTPDMAVKEIWVYFLAYNLIRLLMAQSALIANIQPRAISFKHSLQIWLAYTQNPIEIKRKNPELLFLLIAQQRVGNRPGRAEPRAVKRRPKSYPLLSKPRDEARAEVKKYGHPKKLK